MKLEEDRDKQKPALGTQATEEIRIEHLTATVRHIRDLCAAIDDIDDPIRKELSELDELGRFGDRCNAILTRLVSLPPDRKLVLGESSIAKDVGPLLRRNQCKTAIVGFAAKKQLDH